MGDRRRATRHASPGLVLSAVLVGGTMQAHAASVSGPSGVAAPVGDPASSLVSDLGPVAVGSPIATTIYLKPRDPVALARFVADVQTSGSLDFHRFLTRPQFVARFAQRDADIARMESVLVQLGFTIGTLYANHLALEVVAPAGTVSAAFGLTLHRFSGRGRIGVESTTPTTLPIAIRSLARGIGGFDTLIGSHGGSLRAIDADRPDIAARPAAPAVAGVTDPRGSYTPADYERLYDVLPLVRAGATGRGTTVAIVTLSNFDAADAPMFWKQIGVAVGPNHLTKIDVDGGTDPGVPDTDGDPTESDLDVEQSGAIAPNATVLAYVSPNISSATFLNGFEAAASDNRADVVSCSWGKAEINFFPNPLTRGQDRRFYLDAYHDAFAEMAAQGQTVFTDADDNGAFEVNRFQYPVFPVPGGAAAATPLYSIHHPSSDPLITAAGGTTTPFQANYDDGALPVRIAQEQAWSWSYFPLASLAQHQDPAAVELEFEDHFATGGGGGVSIYWPVPGYQSGLPGVATTMPDQSLRAFDDVPRLLATEPGLFAGRNIPDLSANADPDTGYLTVVGGKTIDFYGGTSFVAPQFAATVALMVERLGHRVGQLNPMLYALQRQGMGPVRDIAVGDIWGYLAGAGYDQATGLGVIDAAKLYDGIKNFDRTTSPAISG